MMGRLALAAVCAATGAIPGAANAGGNRDAGSRERSSEGKDGGATPGTTPVTGVGGQLTDAQVVAILVTANKVDIEAGRLAMRKSKNVAVKNFASDMISDHTAANKQVVELAHSLGVSPEENDFSRSFARGGQENLVYLKSLAGREFDQDYAEHEVVYHRQVLEALEKKLIPSAQNPDLKSLLQSVSAVVKAHLDHAQDLFESLSK
jgi:putative membrane protein